MEVKFTVGSQEYTMPDYVSLELFERATAWDLNDDKNIVPFVATIFDCPLADVNRLDEEVFGFIAGISIERMTLEGREVQEEIEGHRLLNFNELTFGQWVDIDTFMAAGIAQNVVQLASIVYEADPEECAQWDVRLAGPALIQLSKWRKRVYKEHDEFFEIGDGDAKEDSESNGVNIGYMWYEAIMVLADDNFLNIHQVVERPYKEALNYLTWKKSKVQKQKLEILKRKNDLSRRTR